MGGLMATRWEARLDQLLALEDPDHQAPEARTAARTRQIMGRLGDLGVPLTQFRLFLGEGGSIEIQRRDGSRYRTAEVLPSEITFHDIDPKTGRAVSRSVQPQHWEAVAEAIALA